MLKWLNVLTVRKKSVNQRKRGLMDDLQSKLFHAITAAQTSENTPKKENTASH